MEIKVAESAGFCFGVKQAVDTVYELAEKNIGRIVTLGEIIHNETVVEELRTKGVTYVEDIEDIPDDATVVIRSHGVGASVIRSLEDKNIKYIDCTCPFVKKIHTIVNEHSRAGEHIVVVGSAKHPEVIGILGWINGSSTVVENIEDALDFKPLNPTDKVCVVAQTTFNSKKFQDFVEIFSKKEYDINVVNTICRATQTRQEEAEALSSVSDAMIVIGGARSSNSQKLYEICKQQCENTLFIQNADSLKDIDLDGFACLGITAGASTPNTLIQEVLKACQKKE